MTAKKSTAKNQVEHEEQAEAQAEAVIEDLQDVSNTAEAEDTEPEVVESAEEPPAPEPEQELDPEILLAEEKERRLRLLAEFDNYRRRTARDSASMRGRITDQVVLGILPAMDDLERVLGTSKDDTSADTVLKGVGMVLDKFRQQLDGMGVKAFESVGESFDPEKHEALTTCALEDKDDDEVVDEHVKGYKRGDTVIRHAQVIVNKR